MNKLIIYNLYYFFIQQIDLLLKTIRLNYKYKFIIIL